jgi:hypothetical protein
VHDVAEVEALYVPAEQVRLVEVAAKLGLEGKRPTKNRPMEITPSLIKFISSSRQQRLFRVL